MEFPGSTQRRHRPWGESAPGISHVAPWTAGRLDQKRFLKGLRTRAGMARTPSGRGQLNSIHARMKSSRCFAHTCRCRCGHNSLISGIAPHPLQDRGSGHRHSGNQNCIDTEDRRPRAGVLPVGSDQIVLVHLVSPWRQGRWPELKHPVSRSHRVRRKHRFAVSSNTSGVAVNPNLTLGCASRAKLTCDYA